jgi:hypothetical protein
MQAGDDDNQRVIERIERFRRLGGRVGVSAFAVHCLLLTEFVECWSHAVPGVMERVKRVG